MLSILVMIMLFTIKDYQVQYVKDYYHFEVCETAVVIGYVSKSEVYDDREGVRSFKYTVTYSFNNISYTLNESSSPFAVPGVISRDSVFVKLVPRKPEMATIKTRHIRNFEMLIVFLVSIFEVVVLVEFVIAVKKSFKVKD